MKKKSSVLPKILLAVIGVPLVALVVFVMAFDANTYRPQIAEALGEQIGREVKLDGLIKLSFSLSQGFHLSVENIYVANPAWASRPVMAKVGSLALGVALRPLLQHKIDVTSFKLADADVLLESSPAGQNNWEFQAAKKDAAPKPAEPASTGKDSAKPAGKPMAFHVNAVSIERSLLAMRDKSGKVTKVLVNNLAFLPKGKGMSLTMDGEANGTPVKIDLKGEKPLEAVLKEVWPFEVVGQYAKLNLKLQGTLDTAAKKVADAYEISSGDSKITGQMAIAYGGARPSITGTLNSDKLDPADFKIEPVAVAQDKEEPKKESVKTEAVAGGGQDRVFSTEPLQLDGLKAADARLEVKIAELVMGPSALKDVQTKLDLTNGRLLLSPFKAMVNDKAIEGQIKVDASTKPVQVVTLLKAYQIDLAQLVKLGGFSSFIESKGDADMDIATSGNSMHELAGNANGQINLVMAGGKVSEQVANSVAGDLMNVFAPGTGGLAKPGLNCLVAHLKLNNGQVETQGLLIDSAQATIVGTGGANLRDETIDMVLRARAKGLDQVSSLTQGVDVNALAPPLRISGPLAKPSYKPDTTGTVQKVVGLFKNGTLGGDDGGVPEVVQQAGQNACEYTLKHPKAGQPSQAPSTVTETVDKAKEKVKDVGGKLMEGLGGLFGK